MNHYYALVGRENAYYEQHVCAASKEEAFELISELMPKGKGIGVIQLNQITSDCIAPLWTNKRGWL